MRVSRLVAFGVLVLVSIISEYLPRVGEKGTLHLQPKRVYTGRIGAFNMQTGKAPNGYCLLTS